MIEVRHKFKKYCYDKFDEIEGQKVFKFYNDFFSPNRYKRQGANIQLSTENKIKNIEAILEKTTKYNFIQCIDKFISDEEKGICTSHNIKYFTKVAENFKPKQEKIVEEKNENVVPKKYKKVRTEYSDEFFNWDYICTCGNILNPWKTFCENCNSKLDWSEVIL